MHEDLRRPRRNAWATAKVRIVDYWDNPPSIVFWVLLTGGTIAVLKGIGL